MTKIDFLVASVSSGLFAASIVLIGVDRLECGTMAMAVALTLMVGYPLWKWPL